MTFARLAFLLVAVIGIIALPPSLYAAPDNTRGMAMLGAFVDADGTLVSGSGATAASRLTGGSYNVTFERDVSDCYFSATSRNFAFAPAAFLNGPTNIRVDLLRTDTNTTTDSPFSLIVFCPR